MPSRERLVERLTAAGGSWEGREELFAELAEHLAGRTLDKAAFAFLVIELLHRRAAQLPETVRGFLPKCVFALTGDDELAESARAAFAELSAPD